MSAQCGFSPNQEEAHIRNFGNLFIDLRSLYIHVRVYAPQF